MPDGSCRIVGPEGLEGGLAPEIAATVEVLVVAGEPLATTFVDMLPRLRLVACFSTGYSGVDLAHLRSRGIQLTTAAGVNAHDVADHAVALLLAYWHQLIDADASLRSGDWRHNIAPRRSLRGRRVGIVGLGRIGAAVAQRLVPHEMEVRWWGPRAKPGAGVARVDTLEELATWSDALIVTSRADTASAGQIDASILAALGPSGVLVNVSRGTLVDEDALIGALRTGAIAGAALDVFAHEPPDAALWRQLGHTVLTPHLGGFTREAGEDMTYQLKENVRRHLAGEPLLTPVEDVA